MRGLGQTGPSSRRGARLRSLGYGKGAAIPTDGRCARCVHGEDAAPCTCPVQDRCSATSDHGHQCILGAGHSLKHVTARGHYWR